MIDRPDAHVPLVSRLTFSGWDDYVLVGVLAFVVFVLLYALLTSGRKK